MLFAVFAFVAVLVLGSAVECRAEIASGLRSLRHLIASGGKPEPISEAAIRRVLRSRACKR